MRTYTHSSDGHSLTPMTLSSYVHFGKIYHSTEHKITYKSWISLINQRNPYFFLSFRLFSHEKEFSLWRN